MCVVYFFSSMLRQGGSAADAAIASLLCINLHNPHSAGIGGGHFFMYYDRDQERVVFYDGREVAPSAATDDMYNDDHSASSMGKCSQPTILYSIDGSHFFM